MITENKITLSGDKNTKTNLKRTAQKRIWQSTQCKITIFNRSSSQLILFLPSYNRNIVKSCRATLEQGYKYSEKGGST